MNEFQRQAYMKAMAVDCYSPRVLLPGALPSPLCDLPVFDRVTDGARDSVVDSHVLTELETTPQLGSIGSGSVAAAHALFNNTGSSKKISAKTNDIDQDKVQSAVTELTEEARLKQSAPRFSLSIIRGNNVVIIDEGLQGHINPKDYLQLLHNILFAVGAGKQSLTIDAFVWPMTRHSHIDQSETAARQALEAFLAKQLQSARHYVLLMGETAAYYLSQSRPLSAQIFCCQSASPLLSQPSLKTELWQQLQPLKHALKGVDAGLQ